MHLTRGELQAGAIFLNRQLHESYDELSYHDRHYLRDKIEGWLAPCLLALPDGVDPAALLTSHRELFALEARQFLLRRRRLETPLEVDFTDEDIIKSFTEEQVERATVNLAQLTGLMLEYLTEEWPHINELEAAREAEARRLLSHVWPGS